MQTVQCAAHPLQAAVVYCTTCNTHQTACLTCIIDNGKHHNHSFTSLDNGLQATLQHRSNLIDSITITQQKIKTCRSNQKALNESLTESTLKCIDHLNKAIDKIVSDLQKLRLTLHTAALRAAQTARGTARPAVNLDKVAKAARFSSHWIEEVRKTLSQANMSNMSDLVDRTPSLNETSRKLQEAMQLSNVDIHEVKFDGRILSRFGDELGNLRDQVSRLRKLSDKLVLRKRNCIKERKETLMVAGGLESSNTYAYDSASNKWRQAAALLEQRSGAAATSWNGKVVVAGGWNPSSKAMNTVELYDPDSNKWTALPKLQHSRYCLALVCFENTLYAIGGWDGTKGLDSIERYDEVFEKWENAEPLGFYRANDQMMQAAVVKKSVVVIGGIKTLPENNANVKFDSMKQSNKIAPLTVARENASIASLHDKIYIFGGEDERNQYLDSIEEYDSAADKWTLLPVRLSEPRKLLAVAAVQGQIYICGGLSNKDCNVVERFDANVPLVSSVAPLTESLRAAVAVNLSVSADYFNVVSNTQ